MQARIQKSYGTDGGVMASISQMTEEIGFKGPVFIDFDGLPVPFFIESMTRRGGSKVEIKFEDVDTMSAAEELVGKEIYTVDEPSDDDFDEEGIDLEALDGCTVLDAGGAVIGVVDGFYDIPSNPCLNVVCPDGTEKLVPVHEDLLLDYDPEADTLRMELPEGL